VCSCASCDCFTCDLRDIPCSRAACRVCCSEPYSSGPRRRPRLSNLRRERGFSIFLCVRRAVLNNKEENSYTFTSSTPFTYISEESLRPQALSLEQASLTTSDCGPPRPGLYETVLVWGGPLGSARSCALFPGRAAAVVSDGITYDHPIK